MKLRAGYGCARARPAVVVYVTLGMIVIKFRNAAMDLMKFLRFPFVIGSLCVSSFTSLA